MLNSKPLNLNAPIAAPALESLLLDLIALGRGEEALGRVDAALRASGGAAVHHALRGVVLARTGADPQQARAAFERALELDLREPTALLGLARVEAASGHLDVALELFDRAAEADETDTDALRDAGNLLLSQGRRAEAIERFEALLERDTYAGADALRLAKVMLEGDAEMQSSKRVQVLLRTAAYFEKSEEASRLLEAQAPPAAEPPAADS